MISGSSIDSSGDLPVATELPWAQPLECFLKLRPLGGVVFFDSAMESPELGRYSFIAADPFREIRVAAGRVENPSSVDPFDELRQELRRFRARTLPGLPPFQGGAAGLFAYGLGRYLERLPEPTHAGSIEDDLVVGIYDWVLSFDHLERRVWLVSQGFPEIDAGRRRRRAGARQELVLGRLGSDIPAGPTDTNAAAARPFPWDVATYPVGDSTTLRSNFTKESYLDALERAIEFIYAGDVFQVNLSQQLFHAQSMTPLELYLRLRSRNAAPFAAYYEPRDADFVIASASPERFLQLTPDGLVETRPIKGTRRRRPVSEEDCLLRDELRESAKDRAENVMIVDLLRNDLSKVCEPHSVVVPHLFRVETFPSIHHLVSVVHGRLKKGATPLDLLRATFPGGSITGAPKIRAMEIIAELEGTARGAYCGNLAYLSFTGALDSSILIRTVTATRGWFQFPVGGGIVAESSPLNEYQETLDKARGMLWALE